MYFEIVDSDKKCLKVYHRGEFKDYDADPTMKRTWKHSLHLEDRKDIDYAVLYTANGDLSENCPGFVQESWESSRERIAAIAESVRTAGCDTVNNCIYDFVPDNFFRDFLSNKMAIVRHVFETKEKPKHYDILRKAHILTQEMNGRANIYNGKLSKTNYNIFGTKTGRLSNAKAGIPILTLKKEDRHLLQPTNDFFVELDFNAAELRTLLALSDNEQPKEDIHEWTAKQANSDRESIKKRTFAWLYNPEASDSLLERLYERNGVKDRYYDKKAVKTPFLREIETDERRALNYIVQSTSSDVCVEQAYKVRNFFKNCKTKVCYFMHDSVIIDCDKSDKEMVLEAKKIFGNTRFGEYRVNISIGKNFGEMRKI